LIGQNDYDLFIERMGKNLLNGIALKRRMFGGACNTLVVSATLANLLFFASFSKSTFLL
jgi:hypothetical protein